jgi:hypothetical protein
MNVRQAREPETMRFSSPHDLRVIALNGKRLRGLAREGDQVYLLAALDHHDGAVLAQRQVDSAG